MKERNVTVTLDKAFYEDAERHGDEVKKIASRLGMSD